MNVVREYRIPLIIGAGALVALLLIWAILVSPQNSKLSSLQAQQSQLQTKESTLEAKLVSLRTEKQNLTSSCADLEKIATQIPTVQSPTDIDAEESSFESQFNGLAASSGVSLSQFSGFAAASSTAGASATTTTTTPASGSASGSTAAASGVTPVPTTLTVTGNYGQMMAFINGLDTFPRLFVIQTFDLSYGTAAASASSSSSTGSGGSSGSTGGSGGASGVQATENSPPLWVGGTATSPTAGPYSLSINGSIYYTSTPNALDACTKAAASLK